MREKSLPEILQQLEERRLVSSTPLLGIGPFTNPDPESGWTMMWIDSGSGAQMKWLRVEIAQAIEAKDWAALEVIAGAHEPNPTRYRTTLGTSDPQG